MLEARPAWLPPAFAVVVATSCGLVARGLTNQSITRRLSIAPRTAEAHAENIRRKLQVRSRAQIAAWVTEHRLAREAP